MNLPARAFPWLALLAWAGPAPGAGGASLDPALPGWSDLEFSASRLLLSASARVSIAGPKTPGEELLVPPEGRPVAAGPVVMDIHYVTRLAGQHTDMTLVVDPSSAAALQMVLLDSGRRQRERTWRFTDSGAYHWTRRPAGSAQAKRPPPQWSDRTEGFRRYPADPGGRSVTDATALLYILSAAPLRAPGDRYDILEFSRRELHLVTAEARDNITLKVDFTQRQDGRVIRRKQSLPALRISLRGSLFRDADGSDDDPFRLMGLTDGIEVALDPATRMPLQVSGSMPYLGKVTFRLTSATLR